jgi:hypothetical protein
MPTELGLLTSMVGLYVHRETLPHPLLQGLRHRVLRWGGATRCHRRVYNNAGLCGDLVSVGTVGTSYSCYQCDGLGGTALGTACPTTSPTTITPTITGQTWTPTTSPTTVPPTTSPTTTPNTIEDRSRYQTCIANPAGCTSLYAARPSPPLGQRVRARDALSVAEWMGGWVDAGACP